MPTETQKNFRKQMQMLEKELKDDNEKPGFYSYIEKDYISSYYTKKSRKRAIFTTVSIGSILFMVWNSYAVLTWLNPIVYSITGVNIGLHSSSFTVNNGTSYINSTHKEVAYYLKRLDDIDKQLDEYFKLRNGLLDSALKSNNRKQYESSMNGYTGSVLGLVAQVQTMSPPAQMVNYHALVLSSYESSYKSFLNAQDCLTTTDNRLEYCINELNEAVTDSNIKNMQAKQEMIRVFNDIGMNYYEKEGLIHYSWQE